MKFSESIANISAALCQFQAIVSNPKKESVNPHFKSKYADLDEIITTIRPALQECGLAFIQNPVTDENGNIGVYTMLLHKSGEYIQFDPVYIPLGKATPHQVGAALTYARRYSLGAALGIATDEDDDANSAQPPQPPQGPQGTKKSQPQPRSQRQQVKQEEQQQAQRSASNPLKRLFAIAKERGISDKALKGLTFYYFNKTSRKDLTQEEVIQFCNILQTASPDQIKADLTAAVQVYQSRNNVVPMQQTKTTKGQSAPLTDEEIDRLFGV